MGNMNDRMKEKAIQASSVKRSNVILKQIPRCDVVALNRSMELTIEQNKREKIVEYEKLYK